MKKFLTVALAGVLAASMLFTGCSKKAESKVPDKLIVGTNSEFPPFEYMNDKKQPEGFDIAMIKEIGKRMGKKVAIKNMELKSLKKKYKSKGFAAGCSREVIERGANQLGWELEKLLTMTLQAMAASEDTIRSEMEEIV